MQVLPGSNNMEHLRPGCQLQTGLRGTSISTMSLKSDKHGLSQPFSSDFVGSLANFHFQNINLHFIEIYRNIYFIYIYCSYKSQQ